MTQCRLIYPILEKLVLIFFYFSEKFQNFELADLLCRNFLMILIDTSRGLRQQIYLQYVYP